MDMTEVWHGAAMGQPHQVTVSGSLVHFVTDMAAPLIITGTGNITICGKNLFNPDDDTRYAIKVNDSSGLDRAVYIVGGTGCTLYFSATAKDPESVTTGNINTAKLYTDGRFKYLEMFLKPGGVVENHMRSSDTGTHVMSYTNTNTSTLQRNLKRYDLQIEYGDTQTAFEPYTGTTAPAGTARKSLVGINNIWSDSGNITVTYWTH